MTDTITNYENVTSSAQCGDAITAAAFRRLEGRHDALRMALVVVRTWLYKSTSSFADPETLCQWINTLAVDALAADDAAERKEQENNANG